MASLAALWRFCASSSEIAWLPDTVGILAGNEAGSRSVSCSKITTAARYVPRRLGWNPSDPYRDRDESRAHAARQASPAGNNRPPICAAAVR